LTAVEEQPDSTTRPASSAAAKGDVAGTTDNLVENIAIDPVND
jgi:hypothetical protein